MQYFMDDNKEVDNLSNDELVEMGLPSIREDRLSQDQAWGDESAEIAKEVEAASMPEAVESYSMPVVDNRSEKSRLLDEYRELLAQRQQKQKELNVLAGANQISQAIAGRYSGNYTPDMTGIKLLQEQANQPVEDYTLAAKQDKLDTELRDMDKLRDPSSSTSQFYRLMAKQKGLAVEDDMSAWDLSQMSKAMGSSTSRPFIPRNFIDRATGNVVSGRYDMTTGQYSDAAGNVYTDVIPYNAPILVEDKKTQEKFLLERGTGQKTGVTGPSITKEELTKPASPKTTFKQLNAKDQSRLDEESKAFSTETKDIRESYDKIDALVEQKIDLATKNELAASQLGAEVATIFENGRLTDEDVLRYTRRPAIISRLQDGIKTLASGTITKDKAKELKETLTVYKEALNENLRERADQKASTLLNKLSTDVDPKNLSSLIYSPLPSNSSVKVRGLETGRTFRMSKEQAEKAIQSGKFEVVP